MKFKVALYINLLLFAMIAGLHLGGMVYYNPGLDASPQTALITVQQHIEKAFKPSIAWLMVLTALSTLPALYFARKAKSRLVPYILVGGLLVMAGVVSTIIVNVPINNDMLNWSASNPPSDWMSIRHHWDIYNNFRSIMFVGGFGVLLFGVISELSFSRTHSK